MTRQFCTLFDKNYFYRGLAMYQSLAKNCTDFVLWILCMDDEVYKQFFQMNLPGVLLIKLKDFEDPELLAVKEKRTMTEYCWTLSSSLPLYIFRQKHETDSVAYLDSDLFFFSSPEPIYKEMGDDSILIVRHNYSKELTYLEKRSGIYNVSMVIVRNDERGRQCLQWWRSRCLEWCHSYFEDGKLGDQMYLDDWPARFEGVHVIKNKGVNLAPWNLNKYHITKRGGQIFADEDKLIYYHFHSFKIYGRGDYQLYYSSYLLNKHDVEAVYAPYTNCLNRLIEQTKSQYPSYIYGFDKKPNLWIRIKQYIKKKLILFLIYKSLSSKI